MLFLSFYQSIYLPALALAVGQVSSFCVLIAHGSTFDLKPFSRQAAKRMISHSWVSPLNCFILDSALASALIVLDLLSAFFQDAGRQDPSWVHQTLKRRCRPSSSLPESIKTSMLPVWKEIAKYFQMVSDLNFKTAMACFENSPRW